MDIWVTLTDAKGGHIFLFVVDDDDVDDDVDVDVAVFSLVVVVVIVIVVVVVVVLPAGYRRWDLFNDWRTGTCTMKVGLLPKDWYPPWN